MVRIYIYALLFFLIFQTAIGAENYFAANQNRIADSIEKFATQDIKLILFSLDPNVLHRSLQDSTNCFHFYPILGKVEIVPADEKKILISAFAKGIREGGAASDCLLEPRHGLRIVSDSATNDFAICFKCGDVRAYGFNSAGSFTIGGQKAIFDKFLDEYKLKKAE
jgi:hypothetical protein